MANNRLKELAKDFCNKNKNINEDDLYIFLIDNEWKIYAYYQQQSFENTIRMELEEQGFDVNKIPENTIELMAYNLEEMVYDEDCFRDNINDLLDFYKEDLEEYKLEETE